MYGIDTVWRKKYEVEKKKVVAMEKAIARLSEESDKLDEIKHICQIEDFSDSFKLRLISKI